MQVVPWDTIADLLRTSPPLTEVSQALELHAWNAEKVSKLSPGASGPETPERFKKVSGISQIWERPDLLQSPEWPDPEFPQKIPSGPKFWTPRILPKMRILGIFFGILGVFSWGSRISPGGVFFRYFSWKFRVGPSWGSVAGRGVLNLRTLAPTQRVL